MEIFIGNLPRYASVAHLNRFFAGFGRFAQFRIVEEVAEGGETIRFARGLIEPDIAARRAIAALNGKQLLGHALLIRRYLPRNERERRSPAGRLPQIAGELRAGLERRLVPQTESRQGS